MSTIKPRSHRALVRLALQSLRECLIVTPAEEKEFVAAMLGRLKTSQL